MKFHKFANLFPLMVGSELKALADDISANGLKYPIVLHDGKILDGRNRYLACKSKKIDPKFSEYRGKNPLEHVISLNLKRRHLSESQRAMVAAKLANMPSGRRTDLEPSANLREVSQAESAILLNVSERSLQTAKAILRDAPEEVSSIEAGLKTLSQVGRELKKAEVSKRVAKFPSDKFRIIYADPPWNYGSTFATSDDLGGLAAENNYPTMKIAELCALDVGKLADPNAVLFLWVTSPLLAECWPVIAAWGFTYKSSFVWDKGGGMPGNYNFVRHEFLLICVRGSCTPDISERPSSVQSVKRPKRHSCKPEEFRELIDRLYPNGRRIELFARAKAKGWESWGNEA